MIELKELTLGYGQRTLLETVNARITGGQLVALLGRNGTGKSSGRQIWRIYYSRFKARQGQKNAAMV